MKVSTTHDITNMVREAGIEANDVVCAHVSMKALGLVPGGARAVVEGMIDAVLPSGTLMMATYSGDMSDPAEWQHPAVPADRVEDIRESLPAYDAELTPSRRVGQVAEYFRTYPGAKRSPHPQSSFAAWGMDAGRLVSRHPYDDRFGPQSPLGRLVDLDGKVLLLGAPWNTASLFHLVTYYSAGRKFVTKSAPVMQRGERRWVRYSDVEYPTDWFVEGMGHLIAEGIAKRKQIDGVETIVFRAKDAVAGLQAWRMGTAPTIAFLDEFYFGGEWRVHERA